MEKPSDKNKKRAPSAAATGAGSAAAASSKKRAKTTTAEAASRISTGATPLQPVKKQKQTTTGGNGKSSSSKTSSTAKKQRTLDSFFGKAKPKGGAAAENDNNNKKTDENQAKTAPPAPALAAKKKPAPPSSSSKKQKTSNLKYIKTPYTAGDHLPEITEPQLMFDDMIHKIVKDNGSPQQHERRTQLAALVQKLRNRPLRLATMCSGTESPLLALDMLQKAIQDACRDDPRGLLGENNSTNNTIETSSIFQLEHVFSCEIEPFKQAYIERNFHPPVLFRDIRELGNDRAYTAYGALVKVPNTPGCADLLVAGTSCVDYSNLNNTKKKMEEEGESGSTFFGMMKWIEKAQPPIVILENVYGAPWAKKVELFEQLGYSATFLKLDTKDYYIPHTRQRGYLFAIKKEQSKKKGMKKLDGRPGQWKRLVTELKRPASASLDAYMLPSDDPRVLRGRARLTAESSAGDGNRAGRTDWTKCETRHLAARSIEELGDKRPFTEWSDSGSTKLPGFCWNEWCNAQVNRIHDLLDINALRLATDGVDPTYKTMVWNLSQNVDRDTMGRLGLCQCLTPTGVPYVTNRGGPMVGEELLMLQGIPADDLLLTKESEDNLKDLAGNAMSTTIVGACTLCALLVGQASLVDREGGASNSGAIVPSLVPRPLLPVSKDIAVCQSFGEYKQDVVDLSSKMLPDGSAWSTLLSEAASSARKCVSEGAEESIPLDSLVQCRECGQTSSEANAYPPRRFEEHEYVAMDANNAPRANPSSFRMKLLDLLPMRVVMHGFDVESVEQPNQVDDGLWKKWIHAFRGAVTTAAGDPSEFRLAEVIRTHCWTALYCNSDGGRLEVRVSKMGVTWLLFAKAPNKKSALKDVLEGPIARMIVTPPSAASSVGSISLLDGTWQYCLPVRSAVSISIEGIGEKVSSWRSRLGLKGAFESECQFETLRVTVESSPTTTTGSGLQERIDGDYTLLPKCGGACGSLMKKVSGSSSDGDLFFFLASGRKTLPKHDTYVFAPSCHRTAHAEYREVLLEIDPELEYRPLLNGNGSSKGVEKLRALIPGQWVAAHTGASLTPSDKNNACKMMVSRPASSLVVPMQADSWKICPELLSCTVQVNPTDGIFLRCKKAGGSVEVNLQKSKQTFGDLAFATSRLSIPNLFVNNQWLELEQNRAMVPSSDQGVVCPKCAPLKPPVRWTLVSKGRKTMFTPIEDGIEAAAYERALKERPPSWMVRLGVVEGDSTSLSLSIGCNAFSLVQRALSSLPANSMVRQYMLNAANAVGSSGSCTFEWRVVPHVELVVAQNPKLTFCSNRHDREAKQPPNFKRYPLRKEQLRSLTWMLEQESTTKPFFEEEVAEAVLPSLNWRAEGRVRRPVLARGGIIADEVGYGKTAITLGLIDSSETRETAPQKLPACLSEGFIPTKATLVVVPKHLMGQWPEEVKKFLGTTKTVLVIKDLSSLNQLSIKDIEDADIVLVSFAVLSSEKYFSRLARLSGVNPGSLPSGTNGGRHFAAVYQECLDSLRGRVSQIKNDCPTAYSAIEEAARAHRRQQAPGSLRLDGKKAVYKNGASTASSHVTATDVKIAASERDPWGLNRVEVKKDWSNMKCPPLESFLWKRLVVDEFTYLAKSDRERCFTVIQELKATFRWLLSGTPKHSNFDDISSLASLLGVHLGIDEDLPGTKLSKKWLADKESTGLESLSCFLESRSLQWHSRRHALAQQFLDRFVRQNVAELDEIPFEEQECVVELPPAERAIYLELETYLNSLEMNGKSAQKSKRKSTGDRESRMQKVLQESETAEEALLKSCSHFNLSSDTSTALETVDHIIRVRESEKRDLEKEMAAWLTAAFRQRQRVLDCQSNWLAVTSTAKGEMIDALGVFLKGVEAKASVPHGADEEINNRIQEIVRQAEALFDLDPRPAERDSFFPDEDDIGEEENNEEDPEDEEPTKKKKPKKKKKDKKSTKDAMTPIELFALKQALRNHMHGVRSLAKELCGRVRSLRYIQHIRRYQQEKDGFKCTACNNTELTVGNVGVLSCCGHAGCLSCLRNVAADGHCIVPQCSARVSASHVVSAANFGCTPTDGEATGRFGCKLSALTKKVKDIVEAQGDRVVVFCQFDDLSQKVKEALFSNGVKSVEVKGTVTQQIGIISVFQKEEPAKGDPRVLLLKMDDEQSAGLNLTNLNHAVFVHPLLADTQQEYDAYETQAIGRIRRFGQKKTVHVWRFLAKDTIDTTIFSQRSSRVIPTEKFA